MTSEEIEEIMRLQKESLRGCSLCNTLKHISHHTHLFLRCIDAIDLLLESLFVFFLSSHPLFSSLFSLSSYASSFSLSSFCLSCQ